MRAYIFRGTYAPISNPTTKSVAAQKLACSVVELYPSAIPNGFESLTDNPRSAIPSSSVFILNVTFLI